jgi:threonylcarbamoyladenosine tRNA methylthiotransferase MtaB
MTSFLIHNFGCRVNQAEAFLWADEFQRRGLRLEKDLARSDYILVNTCTLTSRADRDVKKFLKKVARINPKAKLIVTGCSVEQMPEQFLRNPQVWLQASNREKNELGAKILSLISPKEKIIPLPYRSRAFLKIQDGCDFRCTFCIIPRVRGRSQSFESEEIIAQVQRFVAQGFKEIVLSGIHLCSYGLDLRPRSSLLELLKALESLDGLGKIRLSSLDPRFLKTPLLEHLTHSPKICQHFHLSLQYGSDRVLVQMGRRNKVEDYKAHLDYLHRASPNASLGADIIVGFPGETEADFAETYSFLGQSPLTYFHVFSYSPREGTPASTWPQVAEKTKKERSALLRELSKEKNFEFRRLFLDKKEEGIVIKKENGKAEVLTYNYIKVSVPTGVEHEGEEVKVKMTRVTPEKTAGEILRQLHE